ncbi:MAG: hypothetical protein C0621_09940 [Desulfuromonas sp.]|nr:MAG: hypothetical protein C0621_09940 [Desulfuromonas sp.]
MQCPVCHCIDQKEMDLHSEGFKEDIFECSLCGASWSINHDLVEIIKDPQQDSFLSVLTESVEADDYATAC